MPFVAIIWTALKTLLTGWASGWFRKAPQDELADNIRKATGVENENYRTLHDGDALRRLRDQWGRK